MGLFEQTTLAEQAARDNEAMQIAKLPAGRAPVYYAAQAAGDLGRGVGGLFGIKSKAEELALKKDKVRETIFNALPDDLATNPKTMYKGATMLLRAGETEMAHKMMEAARKLTEAQKTTVGKSTDTQMWLTTMLNRCGGDTACQEKVYADYNKKMMGGGNPSARYEKIDAQASSLVSRIGGTIDQAKNFLNTISVGSESFDYGVGYQKFLKGQAVSVEVGDEVSGGMSPADGKPPLVGSILSFSELNAQYNAVSNREVKSPQDLRAKNRELKQIDTNMDNYRKSITASEKMIKTQVAPIQAEIGELRALTTVFNMARSGNGPALEQLKQALTRLAGDDRISIPEVRAILGGGDLIERVTNSINSFTFGDLSTEQGKDISALIEGFGRLYKQDLDGAIGNVKSLYGGSINARDLSSLIGETGAMNVSVSEMTDEEVAAEIEALSGDL